MTAGRIEGEQEVEHQDQAHRYNQAADKRQQGDQQGAFDGWASFHRRVQLATSGCPRKAGGQ